MVPPVTVPVRPVTVRMTVARSGLGGAIPGRAGVGSRRTGREREAGETDDESSSDE